ncbi:hypothetical protein OS493_024133 [Desmophyllum pertusum]|uniref:Uncharacterized protein n=1 Tax=Desmophyllum pertusum TaxID=174260 RepID=A0A9W9ZB16_9CNID|nr:hypothetical protein OS493_024133 [Desmophyllum pertusum]
MSEPKNNFVEMIEVWKSSPNAYPVAVIIYDSDGGIEVQLGRKIWGSRDQFKIILPKETLLKFNVRQQQIKFNTKIF